MQNFVKYKNKLPSIKESVFIADGVHLVGDVTIDDDTNIWYNTVIRADVNYVKIGKKCNIQDGTVIHVSSYGFSANGKKAVLQFYIIMLQLVIMQQFTLVK